MHDNLCISSLPKFANYSVKMVEEVVKLNDKQRFSLKRDDKGDLLIRANQGHTIKVRWLMHELCLDLNRAFPCFCLRLWQRPSLTNFSFFLRCFCFVLTICAIEPSPPPLGGSIPINNWSFSSSEQLLPPLDGGPLSIMKFCYFL